jgi:hypothetical protein
VVNLILDHVKEGILGRAFPNDADFQLATPTRVKVTHSRFRGEPDRKPILTGATVEYFRLRAVVRAIPIRVIPIGTEDSLLIGQRRPFGPHVYTI